MCCFGAVLKDVLQQVLIWKLPSTYSICRDPEQGMGIIKYLILQCVVGIDILNFIFNSQHVNDTMCKHGCLVGYLGRHQKTSNCLYVTSTLKY